MKLTAVDGSRIRKISIVEFKSKSDHSYFEHCICCLTNQVGRNMHGPCVCWHLRQIGSQLSLTHPYSSIFILGIRFLCVQGDLCVFSIPQLRRQILAGCLKREDILGISSTIFTRNGQVRVKRGSVFWVCVAFSMGETGCMVGHLSLSSPSLRILGLLSPVAVRVRKIQHISTQCNGSPVRLGPRAGRQTFPQHPHHAYTGRHHAQRGTQS